MLNTNSKYKTLHQEDKRIILQKIVKLTRMDHTPDIVAQVLEDINPIVEIEKTNNTIIIGRGTLDRIKEHIRKINLSNYQKKEKGHF